MRNTTSRTKFSPIAYIHFRLMSSPAETAATVAGRKSRNMKITGLPIAMAKNVPIITLKPPMYGPSMIP